MREPVEGLIRWSTPLMTRGPDGDRFQAGWLVLALSALLTGKAAGRRSSTVGIEVDGELLQIRTTRASTAVSPHDGRDLDAVMHADAAIVLGLAAGVLAFDDALGLIDIDGDQAAVRAVFSPRARAILVR